MENLHCPYCGTRFTGRFCPSCGAAFFEDTTDYARAKRLADKDAECNEALLRVREEFPDLARGKSPSVPQGSAAAGAGDIAASAQDSAAVGIGETAANVQGSATEQAEHKLQLPPDNLREAAAATIRVGKRGNANSGNIQGNAAVHTGNSERTAVHTPLPDNLREAATIRVGKRGNANTGNANSGKSKKGRMAVIITVAVLAVAFTFPWITSFVSRIIGGGIGTGTGGNPYAQTYETPSEEDGFISEKDETINRTDSDVYYLNDAYVSSTGLECILIDYGTYTGYGKYLTPAEGKKYEYVCFEVRNRGDNEKYIFSSDFDGYADNRLVTFNGIIYETDYSSSVWLEEGDRGLLVLFYEVPEDISRFMVSCSTDYSETPVFCIKNGAMTEDPDGIVASRGSVYDRPLEVGEIYDDGTVRVRCREYEVLDSETYTYASFSEGNTGIALYLEICSDGDDTLSVSSYDFSVDPPVDTDDYVYTDDEMVGGLLIPGTYTEGWLSFVVPEDAESYTVTLSKEDLMYGLTGEIQFKVRAEE